MQRTYALLSLLYKYIANTLLRNVYVRVEFLSALQAMLTGTELMLELVLINTFAKQNRSAIKIGHVGGDGVEFSVLVPPLRDRGREMLFAQG